MLARITRLLQHGWSPFVLTAVALIVQLATFNDDTILAVAFSGGRGLYVFLLAACAGLLLVLAALIVSIAHAYRSAKRHDISDTLLYVVCAVCSAGPLVWISLTNLGYGLV